MRQIVPVRSHLSFTLPSEGERETALPHYEMYLRYLGVGGFFFFLCVCRVLVYYKMLALVLSFLCT